jgi:hypothetical protein
MVKIWFRTADAAGIYQSMCEGMWENQRDDNDVDGMARFEAIAKALDPLRSDMVFPLEVDVGADVQLTAQDILDNCADNNDDYYARDMIDEDREEGMLYQGDVEVRT